MPYIELQDSAGQKHTIESVQHDICAVWLWEMISRHAHGNRGVPAIEVRMTPLTIELTDRVGGPDWIRGYDEQLLGPIMGDTPIEMARNLVRELQDLINKAQADEDAKALRKAHAHTLRTVEAG